MGLSAESTLLLTVTPEAGSEVRELGLGTLSVATHESQGGRGESHSPCHEHTAPAMSTQLPWTGFGLQSRHTRHVAGAIRRPASPGPV